MKQIEVVREWTDLEEQEVGDVIPATPCNRFYLRPTAQGLRIAFMERSASGKKQHGRSAVLLSVATATQLRDMLSRFLPPAETIQ